MRSHDGRRPPWRLVARLAVIGALEACYLPCPARLVTPVNTLIGRAEERATLAAAAQAALRLFPASVVLTYLLALSLALLERFDEAHAVAREGIGRSAGERLWPARLASLLRRVAPRALDREIRVLEFTGPRRVSHFEDIWRTVDEIARDKMRWSAEDGNDDAGLAEEPVVEALLQNRRAGEYLEACAERFRNAETLDGRLRAIRAMIRQGIRKMPDYHAHYAQARAAFDGLRAQWQPLAAPGADIAARIWDLTQIHRLAQRLGRADDATQIVETIAAAAEREAKGKLIWHAAAMLAARGGGEDLTRAARLVAAAKGPPAGVLEARAFFAWALKARAFDQARQVFEKLNGRKRRSVAVQSYMAILQAQSNFGEAAALAEGMADGFLAFPWYITPHQHWRFLLRAGELKFVAETARLLEAEPQPAAPKGVVFVLPRTPGFTRKLPLVVLLELKRMGWAIVPLVEGAMAHQPTGDPALDIFAGCIRADSTLNPETRGRLAAPSTFEADAQRLVFDGIDLSHALHEEAAISRRRYSVDMSCPALAEARERLVSWSRSMATVAHNARSLLDRPGFRVCFLTLYQSRLPDALVRRYCAEKGDAGRFFCAHATNGYENYFTNFTTTVATKCAIRNMTASPEMRTASFPAPAEFAAWYAGNTGKSAAAAPDRYLNGYSYPPEAARVVKRIAAWRAKGGKVACAFGKVVCDIAMPTPGGPAHADMKDWINHTVDAVRGSDTLLLIKPHPHEINNEIGTFLTEHFEDLIVKPLPDNVLVLGHTWFTVEMLSAHIDLAVIYNGTSAVELGVKGVPAVLCSDYAAADYPVGHAVPKSRGQYERMLRFETAAKTAPDLAQRSRAWLDYMQSNRVSVPYRYHTREITNKVVHLPHWFAGDIEAYFEAGDSNVRWLAARIDRAPSDGFQM